MQQSIRATASTNYINATVADQLKFKASRGVHKHVNDKDATVCLGFFLVLFVFKGGNGLHH